MHRLWPVLGVLASVALVPALGCSNPAGGGSTYPTSSSIAVGGTVTVDIGSISGTPTIQLEQNSVVKYTLPNSLASGPPEVMTLAPTTIVLGTYDIVITIDPSAYITTAGTSAELNGTGIGGITVTYAGVGYASPDTITIPSVSIQTNATLTIVLDHHSAG